MHSEAKTCYRNSERFRGRCRYNRNCNMICKQEGFQGGHCTVGLNRKCTCHTKCPSTTPPPTHHPPPPEGDNPPGGGGGGGGDGDGGGPPEDNPPPS
ncbi:hypothetical protein U1Q18_000077 [Sarracenia purpurea var. burkii]